MDGTISVTTGRSARISPVAYQMRDSVDYCAPK